MKHIQTGTKGGLKKTFIVDDETYEWLNSTNWACQKIRDKYYAFIGKYLPGNRRERIMMHRLIMDFPEGLDVDHINGNTLDNRVENLRACTRQQNFLNSGPKKNNTTGYKWVFWRERDKRWRVIVSKKYVGQYASLRVAVIKANEKAREMHGEYAYQNPVPDLSTEKKT